MAAITQFGRLTLGAVSADTAISANSVSSYTMTNATTNGGWAASFMAHDTRDIKTIYLNFNSVSTPGNFTVKVMTCDTATGKPNAIYDANATKTFVPVAGWNTLTFATLPTTGLVAGNIYFVVLTKDDSTGTGTLYSHAGNLEAHYPAMTWVCNDPSTLTNFAEQGSVSVPCLSLVFEDDVEEAHQFMPFGATSSQQLYGVIAIGIKLIITSPVTIAGARVFIQTKTGTPGDITLAAYSGTALLQSQSYDKDSMGGSSRGWAMLWTTPLALTTSGTYRIVIFQTDTSTTSGNRYNIQYANTRAGATLLPTSYVYTSTTDHTVTPVSSITWSDAPTQLGPVNLLITDLPAGSGGILVHPGMGGRLNG